jgi:hypothetical protein
MKKLSIAFILMAILFTSCAKKRSFKVKTVDNSGAPVGNISFGMRDTEHYGVTIGSGKTDSNGESIVMLDILPWHSIKVVPDPTLNFTPKQWEGDLRDAKTIIFIKQ